MLPLTRWALPLLAGTTMVVLPMAAQETPTPAGTVVSPAAPTQQPEVPVALAESTLPDLERAAVRVRSVRLDMHLNAETGAVTTRARVRVGNAGLSPLQHLALQISSQLTWQSARTVGANGAGAPLEWKQFRLTTDADHTGAATELVLTLPKPLAPGAEASLDLYYGGTLAADADRLVRLGAPEDRAAQADWDGVSDEFVGLRGFGNVLWYPVAASPVLLAKGEAFARGMDAERERTAGTEMELSLKLEHTGTALRTAWFLDQPVALQGALRRRNAVVPPAASSSAVESAPAAAAVDAADSAANEQADAVPSIDTAEWTGLMVDGRPVSLFAAGDLADAGPLAVSGGDAAVRESYATAAEKVVPLLDHWLPGQHRARLSVLDLPAPGTQAFADGGLLVAPLRTADTAALAESLVYPMAAAALPSDAPAWLREGVPEFLRLLYLQGSAGRDRMFAEIGASLPALQQTEADRGMDPVALATCASPVCARNKAAAALLMLRSMVGDAALEQSLLAALAPQAAGAGSETPLGATGTTLERTRRFEAALTRTSGKDLQWFFHDWIDTDNGLPDLTIVQVAPRKIERGVNTITAPREHRPVAGPIGAEPEAEQDDPRRVSPTAASRNVVGLPDGSYMVAVEVQNNGDAAAEVPVIVRANGLQNQLPLRVAAHSRATIRVPFETAPDEVLVNDGTVPEQHSVTHHRSITYTQEGR